MAETLRIEIPIETIDNTDPTLSNIIKNFEKMARASDGANTSAKKASDTVSEFDKRAQKTEKNLARWAKEKYEILLEAKERISPVLATLGNRLKSFSGKTWNVTMKAVDLVTSPVRGIINLLKNPVFQAGAVLGVSISLADTINTYKDFEAAMSQVQAVSGATDTELTKLTAKAKEMGATTKFTAEESAEAFNYMAMAGWKTEDMLDGIEGILNLAAASGEDLGTTSDIVTDALTAFGLQARDAGHFADVLAQASSNANTDVSMLGESFKYVAPVAGAMKYSVEDVSLALGLMANASVKGSMAGTALKTSLANMAAPTDSMAKAMKKYGISLSDSSGRVKSLKEVLDNLRNSMGNLDEDEQMAAASTIFGKEAMAGMLSIINASVEDYNKLTEAVNNADGASKSMSETMLDNLQGSITLLQSAVDGVKISAGGRIAPYVRNIADWLTGQMPEVEQGLDEMMDWIDQKVDRMQRKFDEISNTDEWQNADFFGKARIAWDEFIVEPFSEWWNSTGKAKFSGFAKDIGSGIGSGIKTGVMALLGIDLGETLDEGVSIGASFAQGFSEGFDFEAISGKIWQGFGNILSSAGKLLPGGDSADLSSILSAVVLSKIAHPLLGIGKGAFGVGKTLFGTNATTGTSFMGALLGSTGNAMVNGSGILGKLASVGYGLSGGSNAGLYFGSMAGTMSGGSAALAGGAAVTGGAIAGATLISSALDAFKAVSSKDVDESKAYGESASWKAGGVAAGAAAGAALGSVIPGLGTAVGALVGAGVGGIAGWIKGNKVKEEYQKNVEDMQKEAEKAQKIFEATGFSIDDVRFKNEALTQAMNDSGTSAEQFAQMFQEECVNVAKEAFGDIKLSLEEVKNIANEITFADIRNKLSVFSEAVSETQSALGGLKSSVTSLKKENWKIGLGMKISETDIDSYKGAIDNFVGAAQTYINDSHYEASVALKLLTGNSNTSDLDSFYGDIKSRIEEISAELSDSMEIALSDGVITLDETAELESLQDQISEITNKLAKAQTEAQIQTLQIKYDGAALDLDSFNALQEELQANVEAASGQYDDALTVTLTNLKLQLADGAIGEEAYDKAVQEAKEGYQAQINDLNTRVSSFNLESIASAFDEELEGIMPWIEGSTKEKLTEALNNALAVHPDVDTWSITDVIGWMGLDKLDLDTAQQATIASELIQTAFAVPEGAKETILQNFKDQLPKPEEIMEQYGSVSETPNEEVLEKYQMLGENWGNAMNNGVADTLLSGAELYRASAETAIDNAFAVPFSANATVNVTPSYTGLKIPSTLVGMNAAGGYVSGGPQLSWLAEEGYGEFVIPTNPSRRTRSLELYEQAGRALGVGTNAEGGFVGASNWGGANASYDFDGKPTSAYESVSPEPENTIGTSVQVNVNVTPEFVISAGDKQTDEDIMQVVKRHIKEMADELGGEIAVKLEEVFSNMPLKEA